MRAFSPMIACACAGCWRPNTPPSLDRCSKVYVLFSKGTKLGCPNFSKRDGTPTTQIQWRSKRDANALTGALEGAMLVARAYGGTTDFRNSARLLVASFPQRSI